MDINNLKDDIVKLLTKHPQGLTIIDMSNSLNASRHTISKYVFLLSEMGIIAQREVGRAKLCLLVKDVKRRRY